jgi:nucleoside-triphosphatase
VGKTTCLLEVLRRLQRPAGGFVTEELREGRARVGFVLVTLDGQRAVLARVGTSGGPRVGRYTVDVGALERVGVPALLAARRRRELVVIDEIGKMEMLSPAFRHAVEDILASGVGLLGTILRSPHPWADRLKRRPDVALVEVTPGNRERLPAALAARVAEALAAARS